MVRRRILEDPTVTNDVLFAAATEMEPDLEHLSMRQFNARYPLRVRRWELSERTRILHPRGPLSKAAAENPSATVEPRPKLAFAVAGEADGANASHAKDGAPSSETQSSGPQAEASDALQPSRDAAPSLQARITAPRQSVEPLSAAKPSATNASRTRTTVAATQPAAVQASAEPEAVAPVPQYAQAQPAPRRRRRSSDQAPASAHARADVMMIMLRWATAVGQAGGMAEVFATLSTVDDYVDRIATALDIP